MQFGTGLGVWIDICDKLEQLGCEVGGQTGHLPETKDSQPIKIL